MIRSKIRIETRITKINGNVSNCRLIVVHAINYIFLVDRSWFLVPNVSFSKCKELKWSFTSKNCEYITFRWNLFSFYICNKYKRSKIAVNKYTEDQNSWNETKTETKKRNKIETKQAKRKISKTKPAKRNETKLWKFNKTCTSASMYYYYFIPHGNDWRKKTFWRQTFLSAYNIITHKSTAEKMTKLFKTNVSVTGFPSPIITLFNGLWYRIYWYLSGRLYCTQRGRHVAETFVISIHSHE